MSEGPHEGASGEEQVGSVAEEAARLFGALSDWAREHGPDLGADLGSHLGSHRGADLGDVRRAADGLGHLAGRAAAAAQEVSDHVDTGAAECQWCPVCRTVHLVRETSPEVRDHLATAAASLMQAAAGILAAAGTPRERSEAAVEHIDLDADGSSWPEEEQP